MQIRLGYDIEFEIPSAVTIVAMLNVHPSRAGDLLEPDMLRTEPFVPAMNYIDGFGNSYCANTSAPEGKFRLWNSTLIRDSGELDPVVPEAKTIPIHELPPETLQYLLNSRYCEVDRLSNIATDLFSDTPPGWPRVKAICDWVHQKVRFGYQFARPPRQR